MVMAETEFGIPEQKKFPLDTEAHVRSAIRFFNYAAPQYEKELASKIISKIHQYNITDLTPSKTNRFYNYYKPDSVEHHGIIGMHWGARNGPPYPLSGSEHNAVVRSGKGGGGSAGSGGSISTKKRKKGFFEKRKQNKNLKKARKAAAKSRADKKSRDELVAKGSASEIYARRGELTNAQKAEAVQRLNLDSQLQQLSARERAAKKSKVDRLIATVDKSAKLTGGIYNTVNNINNFRKLMNGEDTSNNNNDNKKKDKNK